MQSQFTPQAQQALDHAQKIMTQFRHAYLGTEHALIGLSHIDHSVAQKALSKQKITEDMIIEKVREELGKGSDSNTVTRGYTPRMQRVLEKSMVLAKQTGANKIGTEHLLMTILKESRCVAVSILEKLDVDTNALYSSLNMIISKDRVQEMTFHADTTREKIASNTPTLDKYSRDLTELAREDRFDPIVGRGTEIERLIQILSRRTKNNPCLVGEPGVGKTAVVEGLAQRIIAGNVPELLKGKRVVALDLSVMISGTRYRGDFEERITKVIKEITQSSDVILFIDELHTIIGAGSAEGTMDASNILKPTLARGELQLIGATTYKEYRKYIEKDSALERRFQPVQVDEPSVEETIEILQGIKEKYEIHHEATILDEAILSAVKLSNRYITDRLLPDKAIDLIDEAASRVKLRAYTSPDQVKALEGKLLELNKQKELALITENYIQAQEFKNEENELKIELEKHKEEWETKQTKSHQVVNAEDIAEVVSSWVHIPVKRLAQEESEKLRDLEKLLHERIIGQEEAVKSVAKAVRRGRVGLKDPNRPIGSFLFLGPTGVGKTELTKALAELVFGDENAIIRIDMSEYMEQHSGAKLIGAPPGYVGHEEGGQLTEKVRRKPYSVVLFDEIEKAHGDTFNMLLQILDDGHMTDSLGRKIDFKNTIIIMTSNIGARHIVEPKRMGFVNIVDTEKDYKDMKKMVMDEVKRLFRPEFVNRIDETIVFHPLNQEHIEEIAKVMTNNLIKRISKNVGIELMLTDEAVTFLAKKGFNSTYGARPLRRTIQSEIEDELSDEILVGNIREGDNVKISVKDEKIAFSSN
ncbi:MAG: ATP-dependent Clp protease ATP-binding subunit ClpC [Epulopiscium sp. Nele67-Bin005]|nr:MAG: ATP-dependent Clp protease ATP-binding subunit ClpC [Epulopiscium sp. Nele67-Bin005]